MRIGLLMCDHVSHEHQRIAGDYDEMFASMFEDRNVELVTYDVRSGRFPPDPTECDGYLISGSRASVYEDERWIRDLEEFVRAAVDASVPIFGICFGLQVMATALGVASRGPVADGVWEYTACRWIGHDRGWTTRSALCR